MNTDFKVLFRQFAQYVIVGGLAFCIDFGTLFLLAKHGGLHYLTAATAGFLLGLAANYLLCIAWIFDQRTLSNRSHEFAIFAAIGIVGLGLNNLLIYGFTEWAGLHYLHSKLIAAALILIFNFGLRKSILFTKKVPTACAQPANPSVSI